MVPLNYADANSTLDAMDRWREGRRKYGNGWHGKHPLVEAYEEALDLHNYVKVLTNAYGFPGPLKSHVQSLASELAHHVRMMARAGHDLSKWDGEIPKNMLGEDGNT